MRKKDTGYVCPVCSSPVSPENRYCPVCGSLLNWQQNYQSAPAPRGAGRGTSKGLRIALIVLCVILVCGLGAYYAYDQG